MSDPFNEYIDEIRKVYDQKEHSGRTALQNFLKVFCTSKNISITHEPLNDKQGRGAPDFKFTLGSADGSVEIGYLENKKVGEDLDAILESSQIEKYKTLTNNIIVTDYLRFIWLYKTDEWQKMSDVRLCEKSDLNQKKIELDKSKRDKVAKLIEDFLSQKPVPVSDARKLAKALSGPTRTIREELAVYLNEQLDTKDPSVLKDLFKTFKEDVYEHISEEEFADAFAQTLTYSLFLAKLNLQNINTVLSTQNVFDLTPNSFPLIKNLLRIIRDINEYPRVKPYVKRILDIINFIDVRKLRESLSFKENEEKDPYIHFYEDFLKAYDPSIRVASGVYYTPEVVVKSIVDNLHFILKRDFGLVDGLADKSVKVLDFACGTGTFLLQVFDKILSTLSPASMKRTALIRDHILKNIYGFELLIPAYSVAHMKLSQYLKEKANYSLEEKERIGVYFTNTLELKKIHGQATHGLFSEIAKEGEKAQDIKERKDILVITGNPPYNGVSQNNFKYINDLIHPYFPNDGIKERNPKWLNDDYVKFIRFAEEKMEKAGKGVVGIITNHGFLDNPTFRTMRKHLMDTFDKLYFVDLHGNAKKKETSPDGSIDQNVFDIQQGVSISFFVKKGGEEKEEKSVYHLDLFGKRPKKFEQIARINLETSSFTKLNPNAPFYLFTPQDETLRTQYEEGISLREIFAENNTGIVSKRDSMAFQFSKEKIQEIVRDIYGISSEQIKQKYNNVGWESRDGKVEFVKENVISFGLGENLFTQCNYRPFDKRWTYYTGKSRGFIGWPVHDIMRHLLGHDNVGLVSVRQVAENDGFNHAFICNGIIDFRITLSNKGGAYVYPLYLYPEEGFHKGEKITNFKPAFETFLEKTYGELSPEDVLGYIYAVLHSPTYRKKYQPFLKIDFPRIPFKVSKETFLAASKLGQELIDAHLMKSIPKMTIDHGRDMGEPVFEGVQNFVMEKVRYNEPNQRLYFNATCYFADVPKAVFDFKIGGYQVLDKYLKSRKNRDIQGDLDHVQNIVKVLAFTLEKMKAIDALLSHL